MVEEEDHPVEEETVEEGGVVDVEEEDHPAEEETVEDAEVVEDEDQPVEEDHEGIPWGDGIVGVEAGEAPAPPPEIDLPGLVEEDFLQSGIRASSGVGVAESAPPGGQSPSRPLPVRRAGSTTSYVPSTGDRTVAALTTAATTADQVGARAEEDEDGLPAIDWSSPHEIHQFERQELGIVRASTKQRLNSPETRGDSEEGFAGDIFSSDGGDFEEEFAGDIWMGERGGAVPSVPGYPGDREDWDEGMEDAQADREDWEGMEPLAKDSGGAWGGEGGLPLPPYMGPGSGLRYSGGGPAAHLDL